MPSRVDAANAARSVERLRRSDLSSGELTASLRAVADATTQLFAADGGGIMLLDDQHALHYVGATNGKAAALEAAQEETGEGPCVDSLMHGEIVATRDLLTDERWPVLRSQIAELGVHAILGVPLHAGHACVGSLNVYRYTPWDWSDEDVRAIQTHARVIDELLGLAMLAGQHHTLVDQLSSALEHRVAIDRATGIVMALDGLDAVAAFNRLRLHARSQRRKVADVADAVVASRSFPPPDAEGTS